MWHLLPHAARSKQISCPLVCRHQEGSWNSVSSYQFGEQTAIRIEGRLLGYGTVSRYGSKMDRFISSHRLHLIYYGPYNPAPLVEDNTDISNGSRHKQERKKKILLYIRPTPNLTRGTSNISHPLESRSPQLYNISNVWLCKSRSRQGECCRFTRNRRDNDYRIQGIYSPPSDGDLPRDVEVK